MSLTLKPDLKRYPIRKNDLLQAWDAADELLLSHLANEGDLSGRRILILNDTFGSISSALSGLDVAVYMDSFVTLKAIELNSEKPIQPITRLDDLSGTYDLVLARIPKNSSFFEDQLSHLSAHLRPGSKVIGAAMVKYLSKSSFDLLNRIIGETTTSLAQKKARLVFSEFNRGVTRSPYPLQVTIDGFDKPFTHHSNLFSREKLDIGTRFFLEHIPDDGAERILDLGCGNGIVGIEAKLRNPNAQIVFSDESQMALDSAQANYRTFCEGAAEFVWTNCFENPPNDAFDLVLCNPPFHQGTTIGDFIAVQMFKDARAALRPGGRLRVIGNSHLKYHLTLKQIFGNSEQVSRNQKFVIVDAIR